MKTTVSTLLAILLLCGCRTHLNTRSGGPEVTIHHVSLDRVRVAFEHNLADRGFSIYRTEGASLVGEKDASAASQVLLGQPGHTTRAIIRLNFIQDGPDIRVVYHGYVGGEEVYGDWHKQQAQLESVAASLQR